MISTYHSGEGSPEHFINSRDDTSEKLSSLGHSNHTVDCGTCHERAEGSISGDGMKILFLPNFAVKRLQTDDPSISAPNKVIPGTGYWFFRHVPDVEVHILDNWAPVLFSGTSRRLHIELFQTLRALLNQEDFDALVSHSYNSGFALSALRSVRGTAKPPHFVIDVGCLNGNRPSSPSIPIIRKSLSSVSGLIYHSSVNERLYSLCFPDVNRRFVSFGTDTDFFSPLDAEPQNDFALSIGDVYRDHTTLMRAWKHIDFPLVVVGSRRINTMGLANVKVVPRMPVNELNALIHNSRFVVLPIEAKPYSIGQMTMLQCMSMRRPVIVSDVPGISDYVRDGENCLTTRDGSEKDIIQAARRLLDDEGFAEGIATRAREDVVQQFNERDMAYEVMSFLSEVMSDQ
jgi:glycosyltransferase involved in cell wall biosynthesis